MPFINSWNIRSEVWEKGLQRQARGTDGDRPALRVASNGSGLMSVIHQSNVDFLTFHEWEKFQSYATKEGLEHALAASERGEKPKEKLKEAYARYAKTLIAPDANGNANDDIDSDATDLGNGMSQITGITVVAGQDTPDNDAGVEDASLASIAGRYFCDENDNSRDDGEPGVAGATGWLIKVGSGVIASTTTDGDGNYSFTDLDVGRYRVRFEDPDDVAGAEGKIFVDADQRF